LRARRRGRRHHTSRQGSHASRQGSPSSRLSLGPLSRGAVSAYQKIACQGGRPGPISLRTSPPLRAENHAADRIDDGLSDAARRSSGCERRTSAGPDRWLRRLAAQRESPLTGRAGRANRSSVEQWATAIWRDHEAPVHVSPQSTLLGASPTRRWRPRKPSAS
jgi:hypothetical protein